MDRLPPGQSRTTKFPVVGERAPASDPDDRDASTPDEWTLRVHGLVDDPIELTLAGLLALPQRVLTMDVHCVTSWSRFGMRFTGLPIDELLDEAGVDPRARFVRFVARSARGHDTSLPLEYARSHCWVVHAADDEPLAVEHGGPLRVVTPGKYFYKSLKWLSEIELLEQDRLGYWERESAYHNEADYWQEQRFDADRQTSGEDVAAFRELDDFTAHRGTVILGGNFAGWKPRSRDLRGLQLKTCRFRNADLAGADLRDANLTLSKFLGADLTGADLTGADLEGADLVGANLTNATLENVALSATIFARRTAGGSGELRTATVTGMTLRNASGLLEDQLAWLRASDAAVIDRESMRERATAALQLLAREGRRGR